MAGSEGTSVTFGEGAILFDVWHDGFVRETDVAFYAGSGQGCKNRGDGITSGVRSRE